MIHYIGHGAYDERTQAGILMLEQADGRPHEVSGEELGAIMRDERSLRLVVLNACEGARVSHVDPFSGVASSLIRGSRLRAVISMQNEITDEAAITFSGPALHRSCAGFPDRRRAGQSRRAMFASGTGLGFAAPVMFMRGSEAPTFGFDSEASKKAVTEQDLDGEPRRSSGSLTPRRRRTLSAGPSLPAR